MFFDRLIDTRIIDQCWELGHTVIDYVSDARIHYVTKYHILKSDFKSELFEPGFTLMSRKPGIGAVYLSKRGRYHKGNVERSFVTYEGGFKGSMPRYYKERLYTEDELRVIGARAKSFNKKFERLTDNEDFRVTELRKDDKRRRFFQEKLKHGKL